MTLAAADKVQVFGDLYQGGGTSKPIILLFHQAGSNRGEYTPIAPRLVKAGFNCLAIDQRSGGDLWGRKNQTVAKVGKSADYLDALPDIEAALAWAKASGYKTVILWGSSYSASLAIVVAAGHQQDIAAVLAFSPGEYFRDSAMIHKAAAQLRIPAFIASARDRGEIATAKSIAAAIPGRSAVQFVPRTAGVHGSSMLRSDRNPNGAAENWDAVLKFLSRFIAGQP